MQEMYFNRHLHVRIVSHTLDGCDQARFYTSQFGS